MSTSCNISPFTRKILSVAKIYFKETSFSGDIPDLNALLRLRLRANFLALKGDRFLDSRTVKAANG